MSLTSSCRDVSSTCEAIFLSSGIAEGIIICIVLMVTGINMFTQLYKKSSFAQFPFEILAATLFRAISRIERAGSAWAQPAMRSKILKDIDEAARIVRHHLFRSLRTSERTTQLWREDRARLISNALYEKQRWLMTPMDDTREKLLENLGQIFIAVLTGAWDRIDTLVSPNITRKQKYRSIILVAKTVLSGVLPIGAFVLARRYGIIEIASPVGDYITGGLLLWGALSIVMAVDPSLTEKASAMRDIIRHSGRWQKRRKELTSRTSNWGRMWSGKGGFAKNPLH